MLIYPSKHLVQHPSRILVPVPEQFPVWPYGKQVVLLAQSGVRRCGGIGALSNGQAATSLVVACCFASVWSCGLGWVVYDLKYRDCVNRCVSSTI